MPVVSSLDGPPGQGGPDISEVCRSPPAAFLFAVFPADLAMLPGRTDICLHQWISGTLDDRPSKVMHWTPSIACQIGSQKGCIGLERPAAQGLTA